MCNLVLVHLDTVSVSVQDGCTFCAKHNIGSEIILDAPEGALVTRLNWKLVSVCLEIVLILMQDRFVVCAKRTIGSEIIWDAPDGMSR